MSRLTVVRAPASEAGHVWLLNATVRPRGALSMRAVGLLAHLLSQSDGWEVSVERLAHQFRDGREAVRSAVKELEDAGHLHRRQARVDGRFMYGWVVAELPGAADLGVGFLDAQEPDAQESGYGEPGASKKGQQKKNIKSNGGSAPLTPTVEHLVRIRGLLEAIGAEYDPATVWDELRGRGVRYPDAWLARLADRGELEGYVGGGNLDPSDEAVVHVRTAAPQREAAS